MLWSGPRAGIEGAVDIFGMQNTFEIGKLDKILEDVVEMKNHSILIDFNPENSADLYKNIYLKSKPLEPFIRPLRLVKTREEQDLMMKSGQIASEAFKDVKNI